MTAMLTAMTAVARLVLLNRAAPIDLVDFAVDLFAT
jgi:hypothetical protein